jgi:hypothetical protein
MEAFGWNDRPKDILVWHTKTSNIGTKVSVEKMNNNKIFLTFQGSTHGYVIE